MTPVDNVGRPVRSPPGPDPSAGRRSVIVRPPAFGGVAFAAVLCGLLVVSPRATGMAAPPTDLAAADIVTVVGSGRSMGEQREAEQAETESGRFYRDVHGIDEVDLDAPDSVVGGDVAVRAQGGPSPVWFTVGGIVVLALLAIPVVLIVRRRRP